MPAPWAGAPAEGIVTVTDRPPSSRGRAGAVPPGAWNPGPWVGLMAGPGGGGAGRGDRDRDGQAAVIAGAGGGGAAVDRGDGRDDGRAGIGHGQLAAARHGAGADPDVTGGDVVPDRVVGQVRDEAFG